MQSSYCCDWAERTSHERNELCPLGELVTLGNSPELSVRFMLELEVAKPATRGILLAFLPKSDPASLGLHTIYTHNRSRYVLSRNLNDEE